MPTILPARQRKFFFTDRNRLDRKSFQDLDPSDVDRQPSAVDRPTLNKALDASDSWN